MRQTIQKHLAKTRAGMRHIRPTLSRMMRFYRNSTIGKRQIFKRFRNPRNYA